MQKKILTQEDFDNNPELADHGLKVGDEIEIPEAKDLSSSETLTDETDSGPGGDHPTKKPGTP